MELIKFLMDYWMLPVAGFGIWELRTMRISVQELNVGVGVVISRVDGHEKRLDIIETKV